MKRELSWPGRGRALSQLMAETQRDQPPSLALIEELEEQLSSEERQVSLDTVAILKTRSLVGALNLVEAHRALTDGLRQMPRSISLQLERTRFLASTRDYLSDLYHQDPRNPVCEMLYLILQKEGSLEVTHNMGHLRNLVTQRRFAEACRLALPLVSLCPAMLNLREIVEQLAARHPHPALTHYLQSKPVCISRPWVPMPLEPRQAYELCGKLREIRAGIVENAPIHIVERLLQDVIGVLDDDKPLAASLKYFYWYQGMLEEKKENFFTALLLFHSLVEMDPCNLDFRKSREIEMHHVCRDFMLRAEQAECGVDLPAIYEVLREIGFVGYGLLTEVCLAQVKSGHVHEAKEKMNHLVALNPFDADYVFSAQRVALASGDETWTRELYARLEKIRCERPWDLLLAGDCDPGCQDPSVILT